MSFLKLHRYYDLLAKKHEVDFESEYYNVPDTRIIDMLEEVFVDSENH
jgi:hypothetical protein